VPSGRSAHVPLPLKMLYGSTSSSPSGVQPNRLSMRSGVGTFDSCLAATSYTHIVGESPWAT